ncbi:MAG: hypothetical protein G01um10145_910 [Microgenomates group bacterium Gr01-1014_5]|nr:MAG: hypothetical protein G01um10145_910 [Microgenomates group bacterium Gr01-1014_5]
MFIGHQQKVSFLFSQIEELRKGEPILRLAAFLFYVQELEFHLLILITNLEEVHRMEPKLIGMKPDNSSFKSINSYKKEKELFDMTLGEKKNEVDRYLSPVISELKIILGKLNKLRRRYSHHLFSGLDSWGKVVKDVDEGIELCDKAMSELYKTSEYIKNQTILGKIQNKKV